MPGAFKPQGQFIGDCHSSAPGVFSESGVAAIAVLLHDTFTHADGSVNGTTCDTGQTRTTLSGDPVFNANRLLMTGAMTYTQLTKVPQIISVTYGNLTGNYRLQFLGDSTLANCFQIAISSSGITNNKITAGTPAMVGFTSGDSTTQSFTSGTVTITGIGTDTYTVTMVDGSVGTKVYVYTEASMPYKTNKYIGLSSDGFTIADDLDVQG